MASPNSSLGKYRKTVILRDGSQVLLRPIKPEDEKRLLAFFYRLSERAVYLRFHQVLPRLPEEEAQRLCNVDYDSSFAMVATTGDGGDERIISVGRYYRLPQKDRAEIAFAVEDTYQGKGIGTHLLQQLAIIAKERGIRLFKAYVLVENPEMMEVFRDSGFPIEKELAEGVYRIFVDITIPSSSRE